MPFIQRWVPAPKDESLPVFAELPPGRIEKRSSAWLGFKRIYVENVFYYYCDRTCSGWIQGRKPNMFSINTLSPERLAGRRGRQFYCCRCGEQIGFIGVRS